MTFENVGTFRILLSVVQDHPSWDIQFCTGRATGSFATWRTTYSATQRHKPKKHECSITPP